jgi:hypothetical protein
MVFEGYPARVSLCTTTRVGLLLYRAGLEYSPFFNVRFDTAILNLFRGFSFTDGSVVRVSNNHTRFYKYFPKSVCDSSNVLARPSSPFP